MSVGGDDWHCGWSPPATVPLTACCRPLRAGCGRARAHLSRTHPDPGSDAGPASRRPPGPSRCRSADRPSPAGAERRTRPDRFVLGGIDLPVLPVGVADDGLMALPDTVYAVGWYEFGARPADRAGTTVLAGHVDTKAEGLGPLAGCAPSTRGRDHGDRGDGRSRRYRVTNVARSTRRGSGCTQIFARDGAETLVLITCGGPFDRPTGYRDNVIVIATPV